MSAAPETPPGPKRRYLAQGEIIQQADEYYRRQKNSWREFPYHMWGKPLENDITIASRRLTAAEEHAEELLAALKGVLGWLNDWDHTEETWPPVELKALEAIAKAEGGPE